MIQTREEALQILGIDTVSNPNPSDKEIKKAYHAKALATHPDKPGGKEEEFNKTNEAYVLLTDKKLHEKVTGDQDLDINYLYRNLFELFNAFEPFSEERFAIPPKEDETQVSENPLKSDEITPPIDVYTFLYTGYDRSEDFKARSKTSKNNSLTGDIPLEKFDDFFKGHSTELKQYHYFEIKKFHALDKKGNILDDNGEVAKRYYQSFMKSENLKGFDVPKGFFKTLSLAERNALRDHLIKNNAKASLIGQKRSRSTMEAVGSTLSSWLPSFSSWTKSEAEVPDPKKPRVLDQKRPR